MNVLIRREEMILFVMKILINFIKHTRFLFIKDFLLSILFSFEFKYFLIIYFLFSNRLIYTLHNLIAAMYQLTIALILYHKYLLTYVDMNHTKNSYSRDIY